MSTADDPSPTDVRVRDVGRAARAALASQRHDGEALAMVVTEATADEPDGLARLVSALAAGYAVMAARVAPDAPDSPLLALISRAADVDSGRAEG